MMRISASTQARFFWSAVLVFVVGASISACSSETPTGLNQAVRLQKGSVGLGGGNYSDTTQTAPPDPTGTGIMSTGTVSTGTRTPR